MKKHHIEFDIEFRTHNYPGKLIAIEGIDGSGKSTQTKMLCDTLEHQGKKVYCTKEPTDEPTGKMIRQVLSGEIKVPPVALQYLYGADRAVHLEIIERYLKEGAYVVTDRYFWSSVAYGISDLGVIDDIYLVMFSMLSFYNQFIVPDLTVFLEITPEVSMGRIDELGKKKEIYENSGKLSKIKRGYEFLIEKYPEEFTIINSDRPIEEVHKEILGKISSL